MKITPIQLAQRVEKWQKRLTHLGVGHFRLERITVTDELERANASVWVPNSYDTAMFCFREEYLDECTPQQLDETIVHEWVHVAMRDLDQALNAVEDWMPPATYSTFEHSLDHEREGLVDRVARQIVSAYK